MGHRWIQPLSAQRWFLGALTLLAAVQVGQAQDDDVIKYPVEPADFVLTIKGDDGQPVQGAEVLAYACRCEQDAGSHYGWPEANIGKPPKLSTNEQGIASFKYAPKFGVPPDWLTTTQISVMIRHPKYVGASVHADPRSGEATHTLHAGCELSFSARSPAGQMIDRFCVVMGGPGRGAQWLSSEGVKTSRAIPDGSWQTMLVQPKEDGYHLFSGVLPVRLADQQAVSIRNVVLRPGSRIVGTLDEAVPRPVKAGQVMAWCLPKPAGNSWEDKDPSLSWMDRADVDAEGNFEFRSLPRGGKIQLIAICDGWLIQDAKPLAAGGFVRGQVLDADSLIDESGQPIPVTLPMEETGSIEVTVLDNKGQPLSDVTVATSPNQMLELSGSQVLGDAARTIDGLWPDIDANRRRPQPEDYRERSNFQQTTDASGKVVLRGIPLVRTQSLGVYHDEYVLVTPNAKNFRREETFSCPTTDRVNITLKMEPRPAAPGDQP